MADLHAYRPERALRDGRPTILQAIAAGSCECPKQVARACGLSRWATYRHLQLYEKAGIVHRLGRFGPWRLGPAPDAPSGGDHGSGAAPGSPA